MFTAAALVSAPPLLIPELAGGAATETADLRAASVAAAQHLAARARRWTVLGVGGTEAEYGPDTLGTFAGFGADVRVQLGGADPTASPAPAVPLAVLVAGWLRAQADPTVVADAIVLAADTSPVYCADVGAALRSRLDATAEPHGVLVVGDGATTLTAKAPGAFDDRAPEVQRELDAALTAGNLEFLRQLDPVACADLGIEGRAAWQVLAGLFGDDAPRCRTDYQGAPYGVGYHVGTWEL
ncbi:hypothetical protein [Rhodococcus kronopolitis]|uniref:Uncharacterized protein n=1 Tax=Rhodococcus kronopolitis TaxID=1460226 RepID=A0ABV9FQW3_9NOCA